MSAKKVAPALLVSPALRRLQGCAADLAVNWSRGHRKQVLASLAEARPLDAAALAMHIVWNLSEMEWMDPSGFIEALDNQVGERNPAIAGKGKPGGEQYVVTTHPGADGPASSAAPAQLAGAARTPEEGGAA